jgi:hypothetical protein
LEIKGKQDGQDRSKAAARYAGCGEGCRAKFPATQEKYPAHPAGGTPILLILFFLVFQKVELIRVSIGGFDCISFRQALQCSPKFVINFP